MELVGPLVQSEKGEIETQTHMCEDCHVKMKAEIKVRLL